MDKLKITFIGGGNMAKALIKGLISDGLLSSSITVVDTDPRARQTLTGMGVNVCENKRLLGESEIVVLAVKPDNLEKAVNGLVLNKDRDLVISIAAGVKIRTLNRWLKGHNKIIRAMPNLPALIGEGVTAIYADSEINASERDLAGMVLKGVGKNIWVLEEDQIDIATALSGSGPAYIFYVLEIMEGVALEMGLEKEIARNLVIGTVLGSSKLAADSQDSPKVLRKKVTSKAGTTEMALSKLKSGHIDKVFQEAIKAAYLRAVEIGDTNDR